MHNDKGQPEFSASDSVPYANTFSVHRSIQIAPQHEEHLFTNPKSVFVGKPDVSIEFEKLQVATEVVRSNLTCPERPFSLMRTHFELDPSKMNTAKDGKSKFVKIVEAINKCLNDFREYDFSFFSDDDCMWKGKFLSGSSYCEMHVHIYTQSPLPVYLIEANRVEGDSKPFFAFYREFKSLMLNTAEEKPANPFFFEPLPSTKITSEQFLNGVQPIFVMSSEPFFESRLEAAKMLCDLAKHPEHSMLQLEQCRKSSISCLEKLVDDQFELVKQFAMCALSEFIEVPGYPEDMLKSSVLRVLLDYVQTHQEPAYETIQARRECARVLSTLAKHNASALKSALDSSDLQVFCNGVDMIADEKLKKMAAVVRERVSQQAGLAKK